VWIWVLILFNTWCPYSNKALDAIEKSSLLKRKGLTVVAVARGEGLKTVTKWRQEKGLTVDMVEDFSRDIYNLYATDGVPRFYLLDKNNRVVKEFFGWHEGGMDRFVW
jgi:hypothetical protein